MPATSTTANKSTKFNAAAEITGIDLTQPSLDAGLVKDLVNMARGDVRRALREGEICIGRTKVGRIFVRRASEKSVTVTYIKDLTFCDQIRVIVEGKIGEVAPVIAGLYDAG